MKKFISLLTVLFIICSFSVCADTYYENKTTNIITRGLSHTYLERFSEKGWERINVLEADLSDEGISLKTLYSEKGIKTLENVQSMAKKAGAAAAVNGDFFNWSPTSPLGLLASDGEILSSPSLDTGLAALMENDDGNVFIDYFKMSLSVISPQNYSCPVIHINKHHSMNSVVMYTPAWGVTPGSFNNVCEMVVLNGKVLEIREEMEGIVPPNGGYVLATSKDVNTFFVDNFEVGSPVELNLEITPDYGKIQTAVGGGTVLVSQGKVFPFTNNIAGYAPRTAAGVSEDGKKLYLVTVEGRTAATLGMSQTQLANLMIELGAYNAINFDGGGSTTMVSQNLDGNMEVLNNPSGGSLRSVSNALAIMQNHPKGKLSGLKVSFSKEFVFLGDYTEISVTPFDEYYNKTDAEYTFSSEDGYFDGNKFFPEKKGECVIKIKSDKITEVIKVTALDEIYEIQKTDSVITAKDQNGFESVISNTDILPSDSLSFKDTLNTAEKGEEFCFAPTLFEGKTWLEQHLNKKIQEKLDNEKNLLDVSAFSKTMCGSSLFVTLKTDGGGIRYADADQWAKIMDIVKNTTAKNVFFAMSCPPEEFDDSAEAELLNSVLSQNLFERGINVYIISEGSEKRITAKNGVRYITLPALENITASEFKDRVSFLDSLQIIVDGEYTGYFFDGLLEVCRIK